jgi:hypothetical protein
LREKIAREARHDHHDEEEESGRPEETTNAERNRATVMTAVASARRIAKAPLATKAMIGKTSLRLLAVAAVLLLRLCPRGDGLVRTSSSDRGRECVCLPSAAITKHSRRCRARASSVASAVRTPATAAYVKEYVRRLPSGERGVVEMGGWDAVERRAVAELAARNFEALRDRIPQDRVDVVKAGGWSALRALSADPKGALLELIRRQLGDPAEIQKGGGGGDGDGDGDGVSLVHLDAIAALLRAQGRGFESDAADGEWSLVLQRQANKSPAFQRLVSKGERAGSTQSNFDVKRGKFVTVVSLLRGWVKLVATVRYRPLAENFDVMRRGSIVLRRIACDIVGGYLKVWKLPGLPLPLRAKGGYLDFLYLDKDLRVTRGNRGGLFVHVRPETLRALSAPPAS